MSEPIHDLSRLHIDRDAPTPGMRRALRFVVALFLLGVVTVVGAWFWLRGSRGIEVQVVLAEVVGAGSASAVGITANGYVVARTKASVSSKVSGRLEYLGVSEGSVVTKGEVLARLENRDYEAAVAQATAEVASAQAAVREAVAQRNQLRRDLARGEQLLGRDLISQQSVEDVRARLEGAEARVGVQEAQVQAAEAAAAMAQANLENTLIRAPFSGTVLRKDAEVGEVVAPVATGGGLTRGAVVTMADLETLEVEVDVNEAYIGQLRNGQPARIILDAYPDEAFGGRIRQIVPTADRQRATVQVKVSILDRDPRILTEMAARVEFVELGSDEAAVDARPRIFVPSAAVREEGGASIVWVVREGRLLRQSVHAGPVSGGRREIRLGLSGGEQVVVGSTGSLDEGSSVRIAP